MGNLDTAIAVTGLGYRFHGQSGSVAQLLTALEQSSAAARPLETAFFDAGLFGLSPDEAAYLDPQHRVFLECALEALAATLAARPPQEMIGVFGACAPSTYYLRKVSRLTRPEDRARLRRGTDKDYLPALASRLLELTGPSLAIQSACASGLAALHVACQALLNGECDAAIAGAVSIIGEDAFEEDKAFVDGAGVVALRPLTKALERGDPVHGVILGAALGHGGGAFPGLADPRAVGDVVGGALAVAGLDRSMVEYVELHSVEGASAAVERAALIRAYQNDTCDRRLRFGSIKSKLGYPGVAGAMAGFIGALGAIACGRIAEIDAMGASVASLEPCRPRIAAVNAIGMTGAHGHLVLASPPAGSAKVRAPPSPAYQRVRCWID